MNVLLVGNYPPPYGGVSVQISVLHRLLSATPGFTCRVLDIGESRHRARPECLTAPNGLVFWRALLSHASRQYIIHLHTNGHNLKSWLLSFACAIAGLLSGRKTVASIGSGLAPDFLLGARWPTRLLIRATLSLMGAIICRNERTRATMAFLGIPAEKITILSGFYGVLEARETPPIAGQIREFLHRHSPVVAAMASSGPEYGIPLLVEAASGLRSFHPRLGVLLIGPEGIDSLDDNLLVTGELSHDLVLKLMQEVSVFVRPTYFDGDASSVREALALGVPVVASDTDFRPDGTILFRRGDVGDLGKKIAYALDNGRTRNGRSRPPGSDSRERLLSIYGRLANPLSS